MQFWKKWFGKEEAAEEKKPAPDYTLSGLRRGSYVDYDGETWEVSGVRVYGFDDEVTPPTNPLEPTPGFTVEWELRDGSGKQLFLWRNADEGMFEWRVSKRILLNEVGGNLEESLAEDEALEETTYQGEEFVLKNEGIGQTIADLDVQNQNLLQIPSHVKFMYWSYINNGESKFIWVERRSDNLFIAQAGEVVPEALFSSVTHR